MILKGLTSTAFNIEYLLSFIILDRLPPPSFFQSITCIRKVLICKIVFCTCLQSLLCKKHFGPRLSGHPPLPVVSFSDSCGTLCWSNLSSSRHVCLSSGNREMVRHCMRMGVSRLISRLPNGPLKSPLDLHYCLHSIHAQPNDHLTLALDSWLSYL